MTLGRLQSAHTPRVRLAVEPSGLTLLFRQSPCTGRATVAEPPAFQNCWSCVGVVSVALSNFLLFSIFCFLQLFLLFPYFLIHHGFIPCAPVSPLSPHARPSNDFAYSSGQFQLPGCLIKRQRSPALLGSPSSPDFHFFYFSSIPIRKLIN